MNFSEEDFLSEVYVNIPPWTGGKIGKGTFSPFKIFADDDLS